MNASELFDRLEGSSGVGEAMVYFAEIPPPLAEELQPVEHMFAADESNKTMQFAWLSTPPLRTHTHFDNDHNIFVQLLGRKRFVMWAPNETERLCPFPRLHPLWHKSRADFSAPDLQLCANYSSSEALVVDVGPGDVLYVPPFWWHTVETLEPSFSLTHISRYPQLYNHINAIYTLEHWFDQLRHYDARVYALRTHIERLLARASSAVPGGGVALLGRLRRRYAELEGIFQRSDDDAAMCEVAPGRGTPTCRSCIGHVDFDVSLVWNDHLLRMPDHVRELLLIEYLEEIVAHVVGASRVLPFFEHCFNGQRFFLTKKGMELHDRLWDTSKVRLDDRDGTSRLSD